VWGDKINNKKGKKSRWEPAHGTRIKNLKKKTETEGGGLRRARGKDIGLASVWACRKVQRSCRDLKVRRPKQRDKTPQGGGIEKPEKDKKQRKGE